MDMKRDIVFLSNNIFSIIHYNENKCEECGHQKDGITINIVKRRFDEVVREKIKDRKVYI